MIKAVVFDYNEVINRHFRLQPEIFELATELREQGIKTAILSNLIAPLAWYIKRRGRLNDFEPMIFAYEIGVAKPKPEPYLIMIKKLGLKPAECLFVDNRASNIKAAQAVGMPVVLAKNTPQTITDIRWLTSGRKEGSGSSPSNRTDS